MYHYLFTNDLRISTLNASLQRTGAAFVKRTVPSASENKSENNNMMTLGFYFNLFENSNCARLCADGHCDVVILNFIKKFQFPNPRTEESLNNCSTDGICFAPMRAIVKTLFFMRTLCPTEAFLTREEIIEFLFYNSSVSKTKNPDYIHLIDQIISFRKTSAIPDTIERSPDARDWKHEDRQIRELLSILIHSECISESSNNRYLIDYGNLTYERKAMLFDIISCNSYWSCNIKDEYPKIKASYQNYMDVSQSEIVEIPKSVNENLFSDQVDNILLYGVPGCGKSYTIKTEFCDDESVMERIVFHPDYTNADFIGQIHPLTDEEGKISYSFVPGPFTRILRKAYENPKAMHYLIIEEINRGNAPAIFGEVFQLLDREDGESEYGITNPDIALEVFGIPSSLIRIPRNLTIIATMNTADQNVFTLDTAFKRRWRMQNIPNDFSKCALKDICIGATDIKWQKFAEVINSMIVDNNISAVSSEDKRLGTYFVTEKQLKDGKLFAEKVLAYLWDDVFKYDREKIFRSDIRTLEDLIDGFIVGDLDIFTPIVQETLKDSSDLLI